MIVKCVALSNHLRGILLEFGITVPQGFTLLLRALPEMLEDGENELRDMYRPTLFRQHRRLIELREGIGLIGALSLYAVLGSGNAFMKSREFSAYLGLTPRQFSSGGKTNIVGLSKMIGIRRLRSILI
jgi:transposase